MTIYNQHFLNGIYLQCIVPVHSGTALKFTQKEGLNKAVKLTMLLRSIKILPVCRQITTGFGKGLMSRYLTVISQKLALTE